MLLYIIAVELLAIFFDVDTRIKAYRYENIKLK